MRSLAMLTSWISAKAVAAKSAMCAPTCARETLPPSLILHRSSSIAHPPPLQRGRWIAAQRRDGGGLCDTLRALFRPLHHRVPRWSPSPAKAVADESGGALQIL